MTHYAERTPRKLTCFLTYVLENKSVTYRKSAGESVSRILSLRHRWLDLCRDFRWRGAMIIPLGPGSLRDSSSLPPRVAAVRSFKLAAYGRAQLPSPPIWPCSTREFSKAPDVAIRAVGAYLTFLTLAKCAYRAETGRAVVSRSPAAEAIASPACLIFCGTFRSRRKILGSCQWQLRRAARDNPLALPGASPCSPTLLRAEDYGSPDFPPACVSCETQTGDHPTHPLNRL